MGRSRTFRKVLGNGTKRKEMVKRKQSPLPYEAWSWHLTLTSWDIKQRHCKQTRSIARDYSHPQSREPRARSAGWKYKTSVTHKLESQGQALLAGYKHSKVQPLTGWRTKDKQCQQVRIKHCSHSQTEGQGQHCSELENRERYSSHSQPGSEWP